METEIDIIKEVDIAGAKVIEGTPGIGHVGRLLAEHLVQELDAEQVADIYSPSLPPEVLVDSGKSRRTTVRVYYAEAENLVIVTSDYISTDNAGHYHIADALLEYLQENGASTVYALGGLDVSEEEPEEAEEGLGDRMQEGWRTGGMGPELKDPDVYGVVNDLALRDDLEDAGVLFEPESEFGGVATVSGMLLNLGERRGVETAYLMGEVSGSHLVNPITCEAMLDALEELAGFDVGPDGLEERSIELEDLAMFMIEESPSF